MELLLIRRHMTDLSTEGTLFVDGARECFTLEDPVRAEKIPGVTAIPAGRYRVDVTWSPRFEQMMPILLDVPGFEGIRIHTGNKPADSEGCLLVGADRTTLADNWVGKSRVAYAGLFPQLEAAKERGEELWLTILEDL